MTASTWPVYLATVALERNRWAAADARAPSFKVAALAGALQEAGWDGLECWEYHYTMASAAGQRRLRATVPPVRIFNCYWTPDLEPAPARMLDPVLALPQVEAVKFNFGGSRLSLPAQFARVNDWLAALPARVSLLCECHHGSPVETPEEARAWLDQDLDPRKGLIIHPLALAEVEVRAWFSACPGRIRHLHLAYRDAVFGHWTSVADNPAFVRERLSLCREYGFNGSLSVEFVAGTGHPDESLQSLMEQAGADLAALRGIALPPPGRR